MLTQRENYIRNATFNYPEWIPMEVVISNASWNEYKEDMEAVALRHPDFFPYVKKGWMDYDNIDFGPAYTKNVPFTDAWGCIWQTSIDGIEGVVLNAPLESWDKLDSYRIPDARVEADRSQRDWAAERNKIEQRRSEGKYTCGTLPHGFIFQRIQYLRGFENAMVDFAVEEPKLDILINKLVEHNLVIINNYLDIGVDVIFMGDDLGSQTSSLISPAQFRRWIKPAYERMIEPCKKAGTLVNLHSDGMILDLLDDIIEAGVDIINPQDLCNGIDNLAKAIKGRVSIQLDIDRQTIVPYGSRKNIEDLIKEEVMKLGSPKGGLEFIAGIYPPTPPENVDALCCALKKYRTYWWD
ncbi:MAG TPA: hypothetical protein GXX36_16335 [Clostridiaceae bacterium]|nr:hypothetical protein [Clostridiaceae bacterium]